MAAEKQSNDSKRDKQTAAKKRTTKLAAPVAQAAGPELVQLALADPGAVAPSVIMALQRSHGNQAVQRLISQSQVTKEAEVKEAQTRAKTATEALAWRPKLTATAESESSVRPAVQTSPELPEVESLSPAIWEELDYVPPIAPPAEPPDDSNPQHRVGSPYRHLDGISNRKSGTKLRIGPAHDWADYVEKNALARKYALEYKDFVAQTEAGSASNPGAPAE